MSDFHIILPSNSCPLTQPNNNASQFIVDWENPLQLEGNWEAALTEFSLYQMKIDVSNNEKLIEYEEINQTKQNFKYALRIEKKSLKTTYVGGVESKFKIILNSKKKLEIIDKEKESEFTVIFPDLEVAKIFGFSAKATKSKNLSIKSDLPVDLAKDTKMFKMEIQTDSRRIIWKPVILNKDLKFEKFTQFMEQLKKDVNQTFQKFDINDQGKLEFVLTDDTVSVRFHPTLLQMFGLREEKYKNEPKGKLFVGTHIVRQTNDISKQIFIYSSLTEPIRVGNTTVPLLRTILAKGGWDDIVNFVIENPMYLPIVNNNINNIEINIRDDLGRPINFPYGSKSVLTIKLRRQNG